MLRTITTRLLERKVRKYFRRHADVRLVVVVGSIGKASTKHAIATVLAGGMRVGGTYETEPDINPLNVALSILGIDAPPAKPKLRDWLRLLRAAGKRVKNEATVDVIVQQIDTHRHGDVARYSKYLAPHIAVVSSVTSLQVADFGTVEITADEYMQVAGFSQHVLINRDDVDGRFAELLTNPNIDTYGGSSAAEYSVSMEDIDGFAGSVVEVKTPDTLGAIRMNTPLIGDHAMRPLAAAIAVGSLLGMKVEDAASAATTVQPLPGRMNPLRGIDGTLVIDDSESAGPVASVDALQALYRYDTASQRIAVLGDLEELGSLAATEHQRIGNLCNPDLLAWVVVVGNVASQFIAPAARGRGCTVKVCKDAIEAGQFVRSVSEEEAVILVNGASRLYLEETVKILCNMTEEHELVRQSKEWMDKKNDVFSRFA